MRVAAAAHCALSTAFGRRVPHVFLALLVLAAAIAARVQPAAAASPAPFRVVLDAGHGGSDPGATSPLLPYAEKDITLRLARLTGAALQRRGVEVIYTRTADADVPLAQRAQLASRGGAHALVSLHLNSAANPAASGAEAWHGTGPGHAELAATLLDALAGTYRAHGAVIRGTRQSADLAVLRVPIPAMLLEVGYVSNPQDARLLAGDAFLGAVAEALADGLDRFRQAPAAQLQVRERGPQPALRIAAAGAVPQVALPSLYFVQLGDTLSTIAARYGLPAAELLRLNPDVQPQALHVGQPVQIRLATLTDGGTSAPVSGRPAVHTVAAGDTVYGIARRYGLSPADVAQWNGLADPALVLAGTQLRLTPPGPPARSTDPQPAGRRYTVRPGDTLSEIALRHGVSLDALQRANGIADPDQILAGSVLTIPSR